MAQREFTPSTAEKNVHPTHLAGRRFSCRPRHRGGAARFGSRKNTYVHLISEIAAVEVPGRGNRIVVAAAARLKAMHRTSLHNTAV